MAQCGHPGDSIPWWGWSGHLDGQWAGGCVPPEKPDVPETDGRYSFESPMEQTFNKDGETHWYSDPSTNGGLLHFSPEFGRLLHFARQPGRHADHPVPSASDGHST